ncbi:lipoprotein [Psychrobacillus sp. BM2]|uniref:LptM family lipoprotein n=1 Tax=Psychrobacillus sp. BM2 TaxID=3400421 RepID=UPI003B02726A
MKKYKLITLVITLMIFLAGCGYKSGYEPENLLPYEDQLEAVQKAVDSFRVDSGGLLPIKTRDMETDQFIKYPIDFSKIIPSKLGKAPANSFEAGGIYQYVIMDVEENPTVKLVDLRIADTLRDINYRKGINGFGPIAETIIEGVYKLDFKKMGYDGELSVQSPYSDTQLPIVATGDGEVYVDYSIELNRLLQETEEQIEPGDDIRFLLTDNFAIVPAYSLPYTVNEQNEPVFMLNK